MKKVTVETMKAKGWKGYQVNTMTGHKVEANYPLDNIAWTANNKSQRLVETNNDVGGTKILRIKNEQWTPYTTLDCYAERPMNAEELAEADKRLAKIGMTVNRS